MQLLPGLVTWSPPELWSVERLGLPRRVEPGSARQPEAPSEVESAGELESEAPQSAERLPLFLLLRPKSPVPRSAREAR